MKITRLVLVAALVGVVGLGVVPGQTGSNPTRDDKTVTNGAPKRPMTFADLMAMKRVSDPQISPSGKWVMFSVTDVSLEKNTKVNHLWVVALGGDGGATAGPSTATGTSAPASAQDDNSKGGGGERQVTFGDGESNGRFSPDGKWVSISMKDQIYLVPWDEAAGTVGAAKQLTHVEGGADGAIWSPDSRKLMFVAAVWPECSVKGLDPGVGGGTETNTGVLHSVQDDGVSGGGGFGAVVGGTRDLTAWKGSADPIHGDTAAMNGAPTWAEEDACNKTKDEAADKSPVKGQVWEGLLYRHWDHWTDAKRSHVLIVSAGDGNEVRDLTPASVVGDAETPTFSLGGPLGYAWAPDSEEIAYVTNLDAVPAASTNNDVFTLRLDEPGAKAVKVSTSPGSDDAPAYSPDGKWLAFRSQAHNGFESDLFRLTLYDRAARTLHNLDLTMKDYSKPGKPVETDLDRWVDEFIWSNDSARVFFVAGDKGAEVIYGTNVTGDDLHRFGKTAGEWSSLTQVPGKYELVASLMRVDMPSEIAVADLMKMDDSARTFTIALDGSAPTKNITQATEPLHALTHVNGSLLSQLDLTPLEPFWFMGAEGTKVEGFLIKPPGFDPAKKYPVKFLMHGGPQTAWGDAWSFRWNWELMAASGYVVVGINRRGSTGYGQKFVDEVSGDWGGRAYEDLMKGLDYAEAHYSFMDKTRECALGASYGGFMADWVLTHTNRFKCIVTHDGMFDPVSAYGTTEELWFNEWEFRRPEDFPKGFDGFGGGKGVVIGQTAAGKPAQPWRYASLPADQDPFRKWSALRFVENAKTPTLIIHSQKDFRLDVSQGFELYTALQRLGVPSKMLYFPDEGHWVLKPQNSQVWNEVVGDWCDRWTHSGKYAEK
jgi:dipeptidyl aminopeptidase/acylaminoacyl peptidase